MAWMPQIIKERVAFEWLAQTFTENPLFVIPMRDVLMKSANPTPADIENFVSIWHQMRRTINSQQHSIVEEMLNRQLEDSLE
jgi:alpha-glucuronidase